MYLIASMGGIQHLEYCEALYNIMVCIRVSNMAVRTGSFKNFHLLTNDKISVLVFKCDILRSTKSQCSGPLLQKQLDL